MDNITKTNNSRGFTLLEILISIAISSVIIIAGFQFFTKISHQAEVQYDISEMHNIYRICMSDIGKTLRSAGYMVNGPPFEINADTLAVFCSVTQPVDTTMFFLTEYHDTAYQQVPGLPSTMKLYYLMKKVNSDTASVYADFITNLSFTDIDSSNVLISITAQVPRGDDTYTKNDGFRTFSLTERVNIRNKN